MSNYRVGQYVRVPFKRDGRKNAIQWYGDLNKTEIEDTVICKIIFIENLRITLKIEPSMGVHSWTGSNYPTLVDKADHSSQCWYTYDKYILAIVKQKCSQCREIYV